MATALTTVFGTEIRVGNGFRKIQRQYAGFAGANGLVTKHMGSRGSKIVVAGILRGASGNNYADARQNCQDVIDAAEQYLFADATDYTFKGKTYENIVWDSFDLIPDQKNTYFFWNSNGECFVNFIATGTCLI